MVDLRGGAGGPNSFIFMQFSTEKKKLSHPLWKLRHPSGKILDPPLHSAVHFRLGPGGGGVDPSFLEDISLLSVTTGMILEL